MADVEYIEVQEEKCDDGVIFKPIGEIDLSRAPSLRTSLTQALRNKPPRLVIDLSEVPYMDSSGVATFVEAMQLTRKTRTKLILCSLQDRVRSIFEIARLDMVFTIVADREAAMAV